MPIVRTRTYIKKELQKVINELVNHDCIFWDCPGPNRPIMKATCSKCHAIKDLRRIKREV